MGVSINGGTPKPSILGVLPLFSVQHPYDVDVFSAARTRGPDWLDVAMASNCSLDLYANRCGKSTLHQIS